MNQKDLRERVSKVLGFAKGVNKILLVNTSSQDPNFVYLTDFTSGLFESSFLLVEKNVVTLFTYSLEYETGRQQAPKGMKVVNLNTKEKLDILKNKVKNSKIGINFSFVPHRTFLNIKKRLRPSKMIDVSDAFEKAREVKSEEEVKRIKAAADITKKAISEAQKKLRVGMTEKELAAYFENVALKLGSDGPSFSTIVCFGKNAALPHHFPDSTKLKKGDFVLIDAGVKMHNYCGDITRTLIFGKDKDYTRKLFILNTVRTAQKNAIMAIRQGATGDKIHMVAQNYIDSADGGRYKGTFIHALGHSIGVEVHDGSGRFLSPGSKLVLKSGMISSVEPGIYVPGFGGVRFEDDIVVTKNGATVL